MDMANLQNLFYGLRIIEAREKAREGNKAQVPLKEVAIDVTVRGFIANIKSTLTYENQRDEAVETVFVFPVDDQSAVYHFEAAIDGRHIIAECQDKDQARETYKDAMEAGHTAMLLSESENAGDTFECKLGNLPANTVAKLTFSYVVELTVESDGVITFTLPTVLCPRYTPSGYTAASTPSNAIQYTDLPYQMRFEAEVKGQHVIKKLTSVKDAMTVNIMEDKKSAKVALTNGYKFDHDLSLTLEYEDMFVPTAILEQGRQDKEGILKSDVIMVDFLPDLRSVPEQKDSEFVFVIDCSGSMSGDRIQKASETLLLLLKSLPVECTFNVLCFGGSFTWWFDSPLKYTEANLKKAVKLQKSLAANMGGTELLAPLESIYSSTPKTLRQIFLLTDGSVSNTNQVINIAKKNVSNSRIFTFGIGSGASTSLIRNVAKVTNGRATFVQDNERLQAKVVSVLKSAMQQPVINLQLQWTLPTGCTAVNIPSQVAPMFEGEKLIVYALIQGAGSTLSETGQSSVVLTGEVGENTIKHTVTFDLVTSSQSEEACPIHRLAAKAQIKEFEANSDDFDASKKGEITLVSVSANVVSRYTAFIGVDKESRVLVDQGKMAPHHDSRASPCVDYMTMSGTSNIHSYSLDMASDCSDSLSASSVKFCNKPKSRGWSLGSLSSFLPTFPWNKHRKNKETRRKSAPSNRSVPFSSRIVTKEEELDTQLDDDSDEDDMDEAWVDTSLKDSRSNMMTLIDLQKFDGSWTLTQALAKVLGISLDILKARNTAKSEAMWSTALGVACLRRSHMTDKAEWEMIEKKALAWLSNQELAGKTAEDLVTVAMETLANA